jgi:hypothetical protein
MSGAPYAAHSNITNALTRDGRTPDRKTAVVSCWTAGCGGGSAMSPRYVTEPPWMASSSTAAAQDGDREAAGADAEEHEARHR